VVIGIIAGVWVCIAAALLDKVHIDDPVGAVPVHLGNGIWGVLSVGFFANGAAASAGWNGVPSAVTGLFYGGGVGQLWSQFAEVIALVLFVGITTFIFFKILDALKLLRVSREVELGGLDIPEMGGLGYPPDWGADGGIIYGRE
jgi:Amt family ammonium transporter